MKYNKTTVVLSILQHTFDNIFFLHFLFFGHYRLAKEREGMDCRLINASISCHFRPLVRVIM